MDFDLDPFSDHASEEGARKAGGKFRPRAKVQPRRPAASAVKKAAAAENQANSLVEYDGVSNQANASLSNNIASKQPSGVENLMHSTSLHEDVGSLGLAHSSENSLVENADELLGLEPSQDLLINATEIPVPDSIEDRACSPYRIDAVINESYGKSLGAVDKDRSLADANFTSPETECTNEELAHNMPHDKVSDHSSPGLGDLLPPYHTTADSSLNDELAYLADTSWLDDANVTQEEKVLEAPDKQVITSPQVTGDANGSFKSSRGLRKCTAASQSVDEPENLGIDNDDLCNEALSGSAIDEEDKDYECEMDDENDKQGETKKRSRKRRASKKTTKPTDENEKPSRKNKRAKKGPQQSKQEAPKKFPHSTRRKKRQVNPDLLKKDEDGIGIDYRNTAMRDLILFALHKEKVAAKEAKVSKDSTKESQKNLLHREDSQNEEYNGDETDPKPDSTIPLFNHNSFSGRVPASRWSKQETELFYEAIRQFGTDFSLIQQLFPGRTRNQIKLKFRKEDRQHRTLLSEALSTRGKDNSYFNQVIEQLRQVGAEAEKESNNEESLNISDNEAELKPEINGEVTKPEQCEDAGGEDQGADVAEDHDDFDDYLDNYAAL